MAGREKTLVEALGGCRSSPVLVLLDIPGCHSRRRSHVFWRGKFGWDEEVWCGAGGDRGVLEAFFLPTGRGEMLRWTDGEFEA